MSRLLKYKVGEIIHPFNNWLKYIREKGDNIVEGDDALSKEKSVLGEVNVVHICTHIWKSEVSCKACICAGAGKICVGMSGKTGRTAVGAVQSFSYVARNESE